MSGLGAVLRASGSKANVKLFLERTSWRPLSVYWKGELRYKSSKAVSKDSGFNINVSDAEGLNLKKQLKDVARIIRRDEREFRRLKRLKLYAIIDFAVEVKDPSGPAFFRFSSDVLQLLAKYNLDLEVSYYGLPPENTNL